MFNRKEVQGKANNLLIFCFIMLSIGVIIGRIVKHWYFGFLSVIVIILILQIVISRSFDHLERRDNNE